MASTITVELVGDASRLNRTLRQTEGRFDGFKRRLGGLVATGAAAIGGAAAAGVGVLGFMGLKTTAQLQKAQVALTTIYGSEAEALAKIDEIKKFASATPFEITGLVDATAQLLNVRGTATDTEEVIRAYGDANAAAGGDQESFNGIMLAANQAWSKGKIQAEEMNQMQERGIPVTQLLAEAYGVSTEKIQEMAAAGELTASEALPKLEEQMKKDYGGAMAEQAKTLGGIWSNFMDTINIGMAEALEPLIPMLQEFLPKAIEWLGEQFAKLPAKIEAVITWFREIWPTVQTTWETLSTFADNVRDWINRIVEWWQEHFGSDGTLSGEMRGFGDDFADIWDKIKDIFSGAVKLLQELWVQLADFWDREGEQIIAIAKHVWKAVVGAIKAALDFINNILKFFAAALKGDWRGMWEAVKGMAKAAWDFIRNTIGAALKGINTIVNDIITKIRDWLAARWGDIKKAASNAWEDVKTAIRNRITAVRDNIRNRIEDITGTIKVWGFVLPLLFRRIMEDARVAVKGKIDAIVSFFRNLPGRIADAAKNLASTIKRKIQDVIGGIAATIKLNLGFGDGLGIGMTPGTGSGSLMGVSPLSAVGRAYSALGRPGDVTSGFRPGSRTLSGALSYHARGRALDITPVLGIAHAFRRAFGPRILELITPWPSLNLWHGRPHRYSSAVQAQHSGSNAHIHVAMAEGGYGTVTRPTTFLAGEAGAEDFAFAPHRKGGLAMQPPPVNVNVQVTAYLDGERVLTDRIHTVIEQVDEHNYVRSLMGG